MVNRMARTAAALAPFVLAGLWIWGGSAAALSGAVGLVMAIVNLWVAGRIIGGVAETDPTLLVGGAMVAFALGLGLLTGVALGLQALDLVSFPVTGFVLIGTHLVLVLWEASRAYSPKNVSQATTRSGWS
jgi:hypothetical protein